MLYEYALVFIGAAVPWLEILIVVPLGIVRGLSPFWVMVLGFVGNLSTLIPMIIGYEKFKNWYAKKSGKNKKRNDRAKRIWNKYGLPGLAFLGPILLGIHIAACIGMTLGAQKGATMLWTTVSLGIWTIIFGGLTALGFDFFVN